MSCFPVLLHEHQAEQLRLILPDTLTKERWAMTWDLTILFHACLIFAFAGRWHVLRCLPHRVSVGYNLGLNPKSSELWRVVQQSCHHGPVMPITWFSRYVMIALIDALQDSLCTQYKDRFLSDLGLALVTTPECHGFDMIWSSWSNDWRHGNNFET